MATDWGMTIRLRRVELGWNQTQLADAAGMHQANISKIEAGKVIPSSATVDRLMAAMDGAGPVRARITTDHRFRDLPTGQLHAVDVEAMMGTEAPPVDWIVDGVVARRAVTMVAGKEGQGKSMLTQALAVGMAMERRQVGGLTVHPGRAWIVDAENGPQLLHRRMVGLGLDVNGARRLTVQDADGFDLTRDRAMLMAQLERTERRPDLIVLDSFKSLWHGSEHNPGAVMDVLNGLREMARTFDLGVLLIHHTTKAGDTYRGSSAIGATIEAVFTFARPRGLEYEESDQRVLRCRKMRLGAEPSTSWMRIADGRLVRSEPPSLGLDLAADDEEL